jgi:hypothetical protein
MKKQIKVGEMEVPEDYFSLPQDDKNVICNSILESILYILEKNIPTDVNHMDILTRIIESSIITNQEEENYEICGVLTDIKKMIDA